MRTWGEDEGRPLVFWPGLNPFGALQLNEAGPAWAARGFKVIAPAVPGMGESPAFSDLEDYRPTRLADLVVELADEIGFPTFAYVGWSWGASIGVHLGVRRASRLSALVLLDAGHTDVQDVMEWPDRSLEERIAWAQENVTSFAGWDEALAVARERATVWSPAHEERVRAGLEEHDGAIAPRWDAAASAAALHWVGVERPSAQVATLGKLGIPVLLVVAKRNDTAAQVERFRSAVPHAVVRGIDSEHDLLAHAPDETVRVVADWLLDEAQPSVA